MTKPPAMPELPDLPKRLCIDDDKAHYSADQMRAYALTALQSAQPAEVSDESEYNLIDRFLRNNLHDDDYAEYSQALDILALRPQAVPMTEEQVWNAINGAVLWQCSPEEAYTAGLRYAEQVYGITQRADGGEVE